MNAVSGGNENGKDVGWVLLLSVGGSRCFDRRTLDSTITIASGRTLFDDTRTYNKRLLLMISCGRVSSDNGLKGINGM